MRFQFTLNMPSRGAQRDDMRGPQNLVHQIYGEHPAPDLDALLAIISAADFVLVEEYYRDGNGSRSNGMLAINSMTIGKIKEATA